jgi:hypothetical protein
MAVVPDRVFLSPPPWPPAVALLVAGEALVLALAAFGGGPWLVGIGLAGKVLGPAGFLLAVRLGWESFASWPWVLVNDLAWIGPLAVVWVRRFPR